MTVSQPSNETYVVDVPEVKNFTADFRYNFFVPDEGVKEDGSIPRLILERAGQTVDSPFIEKLSRRIPRYVRFYWTPVVINTDNKIVDDEQRQKTRLNFTKSNSIIKDNLDKVMDESFFAGREFTSLNLNDQSIDRKIYTMISGTAAFLNDERNHVKKSTQQQLALATDEITSDAVTYDFLSKYLVQPSENNVFFYEKNAQRIRNDLVNRLKDVYINIQINNKVLATMMRGQLASPYSMFSDQFIKTYSIGQAIQANARARTQRDLVSDDYRTFGDHIEATKLNSTSTVSSDVTMVGYIIDKFAVRDDRTMEKIESIVVDDPTTTSSIDVKVRYYGKYIYTIKSVALFTVPSIVEDTGELVIAKFLISSKPTKMVDVRCVELVPPPPPTDIKFVWDFDDRKLNVAWNFPVNTQRDIKKFQVFRRSNVYEPYQMLRVLDFDDSVVKAPQNEFYFPNLVTSDLNPLLVFVDKDFTKDSKYIYCIAAIDAHGMTSNYSEQYEVSFDRFANKLIIKRISASGAPKSYPNMFILADTFLDSIVVDHRKKMTVYFDPEHYTVKDGKDNDLGFLATNKTGGSYRIQIINLDVQKQRDVNISITDARRQDSIFAKRES